MEICPLLLLSPSAPTRGAAPFWDKSLKTCLVSLCDKFEPIVLEGQLCFSLDLDRAEGNQLNQAKQKDSSFCWTQIKSTLLTDEKAGGSRKGEQSFKVFIHTLAPHTIFGPGSYGIRDFKKMTGTTNFKHQ